MIRPQLAIPRGRVIRLEVTSRVLAGNPWHDPLTRELPVYVPHGVDPSNTQLPMLVSLAGYTSSGLSAANWRGFEQSLPERLDRLIQQGMPKVVVAMPDCFTSLGGNQYINTPGLGRYADFVLDECIPLVEQHCKTRRGGTTRGVFGKSSGGYGALRLAMDFPGSFAAVAAHAPDAGFEWLFKSSFASLATSLQAHGGDPQQFLERFWRQDKISGDDIHTLMMLGMALSFDPDPEHPTRVRLPVDLRTLAIDDAAFARWCAHDVLELVPRFGERLKALSVLHIDVGNRDQYHIQYGVRRLFALLDQLGIAYQGEEFAGTHSNIDWRLDLSLPKLATALHQS
jgi:enterochelin esterase-like enzyme